MKFLPLTAALTLFASPAAAMDYVKCEAMQNAMTRLMAQRSEHRLHAIWGDRDAQEFEQCGFSLCAEYKEDRKRTIAFANSVTKPFNERLAKIQSDYKAEGCY